MTLDGLHDLTTQLLADGVSGDAAVLVLNPDDGPAEPNVDLKHWHQDPNTGLWFGSDGTKAGIPLVPRDVIYITPANSRWEVIVGGDDGAEPAAVGEEKTRNEAPV